MTEPRKNTGKRAVRGPGRTTREDWLNAAIEVLSGEGVDQVRIANLAKRLDCARSSFYWYFRDRDDLLAALLAHWQGKNTRAVLSHAGMAAPTINMALINVFWGLLDRKTFDTKMDFGVRDWARRDEAVRRAVDLSDDLRLDALQSMFTRYGYDPDEAAVRARVVYFTQIGYETLDTRRNRRDRARTGPHYLFCHTGQKATPEEIAAIEALARDLPPS